VAGKKEAVHSTLRGKIQATPTRKRKLRQGFLLRGLKKGETGRLLARRRERESPMRERNEAACRSKGAETAHGCRKEQGDGEEWLNEETCGAI